MVLEPGHHIGMETKWSPAASAGGRDAHGEREPSSPMPSPGSPTSMSPSGKFASFASCSCCSGLSSFLLIDSPFVGSGLSGTENPDPLFIGHIRTTSRSTTAPTIPIACHRCSSSSRRSGTRLRRAFSGFHTNFTVSQSPSTIMYVHNCTVTSRLFSRPDRLSACRARSPRGWRIR